MGDQTSNSRLSRRRVDLRGARYLGGHPQRPRAERARFLYLTGKGVEFRTGLTPVTVPWETVTSIVVAGPGELDGWPLVTDDLAPNTEAVSYFRVDAGDIAPVFELPGVSPDELRGILEPVAHLVALPDVLHHQPPDAVGPVAVEEPPDVDLDTKQVTALGIEDLVERPDVDLDTMQVTALGIEDLVERPPQDEDETEETAGDTADTADDTGEPSAETEELSETEADPAEQADLEPAMSDVVDGEAGAERDEQPDPGAEVEVDEDDSPPDDEAPENEPVEATESVELFDEVGDGGDSTESAGADESEPGDAIAAQDANGALPDVKPEVVEREAESFDEPDTEEVVLELDEAELELDDLQLTALGIDVPTHENGHAHNGTVVFEDEGAASTATESESGSRCPNGHENPEGARFCLQCGAPMQAGCPLGHTNPPGAAFCGECGANLRSGSGSRSDEPTALQLREEAVRVASETLRRMQEAQLAEVKPLLREVDSLSALASDQRVLPLRKSLHEQHITLKRAELALEEARCDAGALTGEEADQLMALRRVELDFAIQMLLEVTELIALPGNDEEGKELVREHMNGIFSECDEKRRSAQLALAQVRGEPHAIRAAELEIDLAAKSGEVRSLREKSKPNQAEVWRVEGECLGLRVTQLTERRAAAIARADVGGTDEAEMLLTKARDRAKDHADHAPVQAQKISRFVAEMMTGMSTVLTGGQRVPRSADRRVASAKRAVAEFRDFFDTHPAPAIGVADKLLDQLAGDWDEYSTSARMFVGAPMVVQGRSGQRAKVQWIKYDQMILNAWVRRVAVVSSELAVSEAAGDEDRSEGMRMLLEMATEAVRLSSAAAKVEVPTV
jgi:hypothetical protein